MGFTSAATNLVRDDDNGIFDPFYRDRQEQTTHRVIEPADYRGGSGLFLSSNGRYIAWYAEDPSDGSGPVTVRDRRAHETTTLSDGQPLVMTPNGSRVMYRESGQRDLRIARLQHAIGTGHKGPGRARCARRLSADAQFLTVVTDRPLVTGDTATDYDAYLRDRIARDWTALSPLEVQTGGVGLSAAAICNVHHRCCAGRERHQRRDGRVPDTHRHGRSMSMTRTQHRNRRLT